MKDYEEITCAYEIPPRMTVEDIMLIEATAKVLYLETPDVLPLVSEWDELSTAQKIFYKQAAMVNLGIRYKVGPLSAPHD